MPNDKKLKDSTAFLVQNTDFDFLGQNSVNLKPS